MERGERGREREGGRERGGEGERERGRREGGREGESMNVPVFPLHTQDLPEHNSSSRFL